MTTNTKFPLALLVILGISLFLIPATKADDHELKQTNMSVFFHDYASSGPNSTVFPIFGLPGKNWTFTQFGTLFVSEDLITEGPDQKSAAVGRGQGIYVSASLDGIHTYVSISIIFTNEAYNGSTTQIQGNSNQLVAIREYGVVSGTGQFRCAKGYVTFEIYYFDPSNSYSILRCNVSIRHY